AELIDLVGSAELLEAVDGHLQVAADLERVVGRIEGQLAEAGVGVLVVAGLEGLRHRLAALFLRPVRPRRGRLPGDGRHERQEHPHDARSPFPVHLRLPALRGTIGRTTTAPGAGRRGAVPFSRRFEFRGSFYLQDETAAIWIGALAWALP